MKNKNLFSSILSTLIITTLLLSVMPDRPASAGTTINVSTAAELITAINNANSEGGSYLGADIITLDANINLTFTCQRLIFILDTDLI